MTLKEKLQERVDINRRYTCLSYAEKDWPIGELEFVDMGVYGMASYFEHFRTWADGYSFRKERDKLEKGLWHGSLL